MGGTLLAPTLPSVARLIAVGRMTPSLSPRAMISLPLVWIRSCCKSVRCRMRYARCPATVNSMLSSSSNGLRVVKFLKSPVRDMSTVCGLSSLPAKHNRCCTYPTACG